MGIEVERFVDEVNFELICTICCDVLENPVECTTCQSNFCYSCSEMWKAKSNECPNRCELILQKPHRFLRLTLNNLSLYCQHKDKGCEIIVKLEFLAKHEETECLYRDILCENTGCLAVLSAVGFKEHSASCMYRQSECSECGETITVLARESHSCVKYLSYLLANLNLKIQQNDNTIIQLEESFRQKGINNSLRIHSGIPCSTCNVPSIIGIRNICLQCPDFNLCWACRTNTTHVHSDFFQLVCSGIHEGIVCASCRIQDIPNIRFKCKICEDFSSPYIDLCFQCKLTTAHQHEEFFAWEPLHIMVTPIPPKQLASHKGSFVERSWSIENFGLNHILNPILSLVSGDPCSI